MKKKKGLHVKTSPHPRQKIMVRPLAWHKGWNT